MFANLVSGHTSLADWLFLIGMVVAALAAVVSLPNITTGAKTYGATLLALALALVAAGWFVL